MDRLMMLLPEVYMLQLKEKFKNVPDELRLSVGKPVYIRSPDGEQRLWPKATQEDLDMVVRSACRQSVYAHAETMKKGYITVEGGHRIGIAGFAVMRDGQVHSIKHVSSLVIRIAKQIVGCAEGVFQFVDRSTLLIGPPGSGKTTLLRDLVRLLSDRRHQRVSLVDERAELSAGVFGVPQLNIGERTDVLVNVPKAEGAMMMLRTMDPQWIAVDEITSAQDISAMEQISYCGVNILATAHGCGAEDLISRPLYRSMMDRKLFSKIVILGADRHYHIQEV